MIWLGDLNYRIAMPDHEARTLIANEDWEVLLEKDQVWEGHFAHLVMIKWKNCTFVAS